ncbi:Cysteine synthase [Sebaldella termitidis]|uniref:Cysteine synthase n=1 Tax=Sebaldella termitidis (strain ATCC 33386 / NCTC 11300) TaxID=526218 RepID=D1AP71_SEBTE|nr:cysteine synthase A [Sebaldella termitidis]ACZ09905.1 cysteine synthase [Sebaldella termitidis ATCC 33386]SUI25237.1 Cysteine synthase [Sebaldella termitidis]
MVYKNLLDLIGNTPIVKLNNIFNDENIADIYVKLEGFNLGSSVKDRAALGMIEAAEKSGRLKPGGTIVEPTSGNTGISLALISSLKGYKIIIIMPDTMSVERRSIIAAYGAEIILTDGAKGMKGAIEKAEELLKNNPDYFMPQQFENSANPEMHYKTTGEEIIKDLPDLDAFVAGVGTGGTITGIGKKLKEFNPDIKIIAVEPTDSAVLSGEKPGKHKLQGIGAGFIPKILDLSVIDEVIRISNDKAFEFCRIISRQNALFLGISSGAAIAAAYETAKKLGKGKKVLAVSPDGGEKYLSTDVYK